MSFEERELRSKITTKYNNSSILAAAAEARAHARARFWSDPEKAKEQTKRMMEKRVHPTTKLDMEGLRIMYLKKRLVEPQGIHVL